MQDLPAPIEGASPSLKALGKRRQVSPPPDSNSLEQHPSGEIPAIKKLKTGAADTGAGREKRRTRSSLGGSSADAGVARDDGALWKPELPLNTPILLTLQPLPGVSHHPPPPAHVPTLDNTSALPPSATPVVAAPRFRLLTLADGFARSRHAGAAEADTSDAHYHRLHRFPEILEKRSARLERDRLIHERAKLITELEELRSRSWVYQGAQGGKGEEERKRKIKERELRLKRYDILLPNQPRKSQVLNVSGSQAAPAVISSSRDASPALVPALVPARRASEQVRHSTPLSASGDGGTTIRIKFSGLTASGSGPLPSPSKSVVFKPSRFPRGRERRTLYTEHDDDDDADEDQGNDSDAEGRLQDEGNEFGHHTVKRDRKAERDRAAERIRLGLPPRASIEKAAGASKKSKLKLKLNAKHRNRERFESPMEVDSASDDQGKESRSTSAHTGNPRRRIKDSFFESEALRESVMSTAGRRSSGRVAYAFGQRVLDSVFFSSEFELHGGRDGEHDGELLEEMVRRREGEDRPRPFLVNGVAVPASELITTTTRAFISHSPPTTFSAPSTYCQPPVPLAIVPPLPTHQHGTRHLKRSVITMSPRGRLELKVKIDQ